LNRIPKRSPEAIFKVINAIERGTFIDYSDDYRLAKSDIGEEKKHNIASPFKMSSKIYKP
jgi:hypothetical protein